MKIPIFTRSCALSREFAKNRTAASKGGGGRSAKGLRQTHRNNQQQFSTRLKPLTTSHSPHRATATAHCSHKNTHSLAGSRLLPGSVRARSQFISDSLLVPLVLVVVSHPFCCCKWKRIAGICIQMCETQKCGVAALQQQPKHTEGNDGVAHQTVSLMPIPTSPHPFNPILGLKTPGP